ncbi:MAG: alanine racemase [bacterium]
MKTKDQTYVEISIPNILHNVKELKGLLGRSVKFMAVVKADAYGHGAVPVSMAIEGSVDCLAVATIAEALELKRAGIKVPILLLSETHPSNAEDIVKNGFIQTVYTIGLAKAMSVAARKLKKKARVHIKIDTGMGRVGAHFSKAEDLFRKISRLPGVKIEGIFTHFAGAEEKGSFTAEQMRKFRSFISKIDPVGCVLHAANSAAVLYHKESHLDMARVGLSMYGLYPPGGRKHPIKLKPALEFKTHVVFLKKVPARTPLSYGSTHVAKKGTTIATLPAGYADGLPRALSNKGEVLIRGKRFPIVGRICMDLTLIDVGDSKIKVGDEVTFIGRQGKEIISADDVAKLADTISYEIICGIGKRVPRVYLTH